MNKLSILKWAVTITVVSVLSCNREKAAVNIHQDVGLPPSLTAGKEDPGLIVLSEKEQAELSIELFMVDSKLQDYLVSAPGEVFAAPNHVSVISTPIDGQISSIRKFEGNWVKKGEELFQIRSFEFGNMVSDYLQAFAEEKFQTNRLSRLKQLVEETISSASELEKATAEYQRAVISTKAAYSKLKAVGVSDEEISFFTEASVFEPLLRINSPIDGIIEKNFVELGQSVNALENLSRVLDTREVLVRGFHSPDDARLISAGDSVFISKRESGEYMVKSVIASLNPGLDENTRSVISNIIVPTVSGWPKPGEQARVEVFTSTKMEIIAIPSGCLSYDGNQAVVFVLKDKGIWEQRPIEVSEIRDNLVFVKQGLTGGEQVASSHVFSLKALSRFDRIAEE